MNAGQRATQLVVRSEQAFVWTHAEPAAVQDDICLRVLVLLHDIGRPASGNRMNVYVGYRHPVLLEVTNLDLGDDSECRGQSIIQRRVLLPRVLNGEMLPRIFVMN